MNDELAFIDGLRARLLGPSQDDAIPAFDCETGVVTVFLLDNSGSMCDDDYLPSRYLAGVGAIGEYLAARLAVGATDKVTVIIFDDHTKIVCENVGLPRALSDVIQRLKRQKTGGGTDIPAGLIAAHDVFRRYATGASQRLILLTDGHGGDCVQQSMEMKSEGIVIDCVGIGGSPSEVCESMLRETASVLNGEVRYRFIGDQNQLMEHFKVIANDLTFIR